MWKHFIADVHLSLSDFFSDGTFLLVLRAYRALVLGTTPSSVLGASLPMGSHSDRFQGSVPVFATV